jgi:hypothetical protein
MKGTIRIVVGFLIVLGAVGAEDYALEMMTDPPHVLQTLGLAVIGLGLMFSGATAVKENV